METKLRDQMKTYRKLLQKVSRTKTKIMCALREVGCREAAEMLQTPAKETGAMRCSTCLGCVTMQTMGPCLRCEDCEKSDECTEHTRLCFRWKQPPSTFVDGSIVSGVSTLCNPTDYDISKYKQLLEQLDDVSAEIEATLDEFPAGAEQHSNDRYGKARRDRDVANEEEHFVMVEALLKRHQDQQALLADVEMDQEVVDDAETVHGRFDTAPFGLTSNTMTHYTFERFLDQAQAPPDNHGRADWEVEANDFVDTTIAALGIDLGAGAAAVVGGGEVVVEPGPALETLPPADLEAEAAANVGGGDVVVEHGPALETLPPMDLGARPKVQASMSDVELVPPVGGATATTSSPAIVPAMDQPSLATKLKEVQVTMAQIVGTEKPRVSVTTASSAPVYSQASVTSCAASTMTTHTTTTTPTSSVFTPVTPTFGRGRRRSSSEGVVQEKNRTGPDVEELSRVKLLVAARTQKISQDLVALLSQAQSATGTATQWIEEELRQAQDQLDRLENLESTTWVKIAMIRGRSAQKIRIQQWKEWQGRQMERVRQVKARVREIRQLAVASGGDHQCQRSYGHVEKVKLPMFSGKQEEFSEFKTQFRELCQGERYTPVLELAQMKLKLPREALAAISGLRCPDEAWLRLEELYGNRELSIMSALKTLRDFKTTKSAPHEQVIELAMTVQKCKTELSNVDALHELTGDRESIACIVHALPSDHPGQVVRPGGAERHNEEGRVSDDMAGAPASECHPRPYGYHGCEVAGRRKRDCLQTKSPSWRRRQHGQGTNLQRAPRAGRATTKERE